MSHTPPGGEEETIWGVLAIAAALRRVSQYPLVVLSNSTQFPDGTSYAQAFTKLRVQMLPVYPIELTGQQAASLATPRFGYSLWKLHIWNLTQFDKLIWLDSDTIPVRSVDWLFERDGVWAEPDDPYCTGVPRGPCAGVFLMQPDEGDYRGLMAFTKDLTDMLLADQTIIPSYFAQVKGEPVNLLRYEDAHLGWCVGAVPPAFRDSNGKEFLGLWSLPAIVHKSGGPPGGNLCFSPKLAQQLYKVGNATINLCHFNPVGIYWRDRFCEAAHREVGLKTAEVLSFCSDACWYGHGGAALAEDLQRWGGGVVCTPNTTTDPAVEAAIRQLELGMTARPAILGS